MIQSVKVDIVYYTIGGDFEMEFNLCGCCRMRLLTDKADSQADFSKCLARAVKRSRVIMLCGPLFGEKGLIQTVSKVTGIDICKLDNKAYDLSEDMDVDILKGSTALVTSDGVFGGCIIESNSQSIILLTESKSLRKNVMKQLIYPYITKLSITPSGDAQESENTPDEETPAVVSQELPEEQEPVLQDETANGNDDSEKTTETDKESVSDSADASLENETVPEPETPSEPETTDDNDFVIDISKAQTAKPDNNGNDQPDPFDNALIIDIHNGDNLSVEEKNQKYYLFEDEGETANPKTNLDIAIRVIIAFIALILLIILFLAIAKPIIAHRDILSYLRDIFSLNVFSGFTRLI